MTYGKPGGGPPGGNVGGGIPIPGGGNLYISDVAIRMSGTYPGKGGGIPIGGNPGMPGGGGWNGLAPGF